MTNQSNPNPELVNAIEEILGAEPMVLEEVQAALVQGYGLATEREIMDALTWMRAENIAYWGDSRRVWSFYLSRPCREKNYRTAILRWFRDRPQGLPDQQTLMQDVAGGNYDPALITVLEELVESEELVAVYWVNDVQTGYGCFVYRSNRGEWAEMLNQIKQEEDALALAAATDWLLERVGFPERHNAEAYAYRAATGWPLEA